MMSIQLQKQVGGQRFLEQELRARKAACAEAAGHAEQARNFLVEDLPVPGDKAPETYRKRVACRREVLIVDDNDDTRDLLKLWIEDHGFQVATASNGAEALSWIARGGRPALILLDLLMPVMSGWEVLEKLKGDVTLSSIPVAVMSAHHRGAVPADHFLAKPLDLEALIALVQAHCGKGREDHP
jgi:CheY-like chemotaxis protein